LCTILLMKPNIRNLYKTFHIKRTHFYFQADQIKMFNTKPYVNQGFLFKGTHLCTNWTLVKTEAKWIVQL